MRETLPHRKGRYSGQEGNAMERHQGENEQNVLRRWCALWCGWAAGQGWLGMRFWDADVCVVLEFPSQCLSVLSLTEPAEPTLTRSDGNVTASLHLVRTVVTS